MSNIHHEHLIDPVVAMLRATDVFPEESHPDAKVKEVKSWLNSKGVRDFEPVSLFCDQLAKVRSLGVCCP